MGQGRLTARMLTVPAPGSLHSAPLEQLRSSAKGGQQKKRKEKKESMTSAASFQLFHLYHYFALHENIDNLKWKSATLSSYLSMGNFRRQK